MRSRQADTITDDAVLGRRLKLLQPARGHRAGHDAILLAAAVPPVEHAIELGAGVGAAGLALLARDIAKRVTLVEIDGELAELARSNAKRNGFDRRALVVKADVVKLARGGGPKSPKPASSDCVLMNPPFNDGARGAGSPNIARRRAHVAGAEGIKPWIAAADRLLRPHGRLVMIHRPEAMAAILAALAGRFGAVELIPVHSRAGAPAIRLIARAIKGRRTPPALLPGFLLADADGTPSPAAEAVLRGGASLDPA